jgi:hypothetical protein
MATLICCRLCRVEFARIALADGSAAIVCLDCDVISIERKHAPRRRVDVATAKSAARSARRTRVVAAPHA